ncbi:MAG: sigma-70 family RNA polymerase sigma factor [Thermoflexales bacterium]|nr:sigma-70 family RNA polymerase sigma factor [Thermoflexales bacterium]
MRPKDEKSLIKRARRRDEAAISELYHRNVDSIYRYMVHRVDDAATAEDLTAEVFLRALESIESYTDTGFPFSAWLFKIARARVIDHWRRQQRRPQVELDETMPDERAPFPNGAPLGNGRIELGEANVKLNQAIRLLSDEQQQVIILKFYIGLSASEIAHILNKTEGAVKALQHRGLAALGRIVEQSG